MWNDAKCTEKFTGLSGMGVFLENGRLRIEENYFYCRKGPTAVGPNRKRFSELRKIHAQSLESGIASGGCRRRRREV
jgi:hypothetical protein